MENLLRDIVAHNLQNRTVALIDNGSWAAMCNKQMKEELDKLKNIEFLEPIISLKSALSENQIKEIEDLADKIASEVIFK